MLEDLTHWDDRALVQAPLVAIIMPRCILRAGDLLLDCLMTTIYSGCSLNIAVRSAKYGHDPTSSAR